MKLVKELIAHVLYRNPLVIALVGLICGLTVIFGIIVPHLVM